MESNAKKIMDGDIKTINPLTKLWRVVENSSILRHGLSEYIKLVEIAAILVLGSVEDERTFSILSFMKDKLRNRVQTHLPLVVGMHGQSFFDINMFSYEEAYNEWKKSIRLTDNIMRKSCSSADFFRLLLLPCGFLVAFLLFFLFL